MEDSRMIDLLFQRDEKGLAEVNARYGREMHTLARQISGSTEDAEEICNDALDAVWNSIPPRRPEVLPAYVMRIVRNLACKRVRSRSAEKRSGTLSLDGILEELGDVFPAAEDRMSDSKAISDTISYFLSGCSREDRILFVRRFFYADSLADASAFVGLGKGAAAVRLTRLKQRLGQVLREEGIAL